VNSPVSPVCRRPDGGGQGAEPPLRGRAALRPEHPLLRTLCVRVTRPEGQAAGGGVPGETQQPLPLAEHGEVSRVESSQLSLDCEARLKTDQRTR